MAPPCLMFVELSETDIMPNLPGGTQVDDLEPPGLITSLPISARLGIFSDTRSFAVEGSHYGHGYLIDRLMADVDV